VAVTDIPLAPLSAADVVPLIADVLAIPQRRARPLATLVCRKTGGIALFALHFLDRLERDGLLRFDPVRAG
jgi:predicted ATPase